MNSIKNIRIFSILIFILICSLVCIEFGFNNDNVSKSTRKLSLVDQAYKINNALLYCKFYITKILRGVSDPNQLKSYINELKTYQMVIDTNIKEIKYSDLSQGFATYFTENKLNVMIYQNNQEKYIQGYSNIVNSIYEIATSLFQITSPNTTISLQNTYTFLLQYNLLNDYFIKWNNSTQMLVTELNNSNDLNYVNIVIFALSVVISIISLIVVKQLLNQFIREREKPIDLFLTIKKPKYDELKASAEGFLNKLLNQIYGNEETEEDMLDDLAMTVNLMDFSIQKFTKSDENKKTYKSNNDYLVLLLRISGFFILFQLYMAFKFVYFYLSFNNMTYFSQVFNSTQYLQTDFLLTIDVHEQYLFNNSVSILSNKNTLTSFENTILNLGNSFQDMLQQTYEKKQFINDTYLTNFKKMLNDDLCNTNNPLYFKNLTDCTTMLDGSMKQGIKQVVGKLFSLIRHTSVDYLNSMSSYTDQRRLNLLNRSSYRDIDFILTDILRPWMDKTIVGLIDNFQSYVSNIKILNICSFSALILLVILLYFVYWRNFEDSLNELLKNSIDLLNIIPEIIKFHLVKLLKDEHFECE